jgi:hypothetical protein
MYKTIELYVQKKTEKSKRIKPCIQNDNCKSQTQVSWYYTPIIQSINKHKSVGTTHQSFNQSTNTSQLSLHTNHSINQQTQVHI